MNAVAPTVMPILATPLGVATVPDAAEFNGALCELFARRAALGRGLGPGDPLRVRGTDDLMEWPEAPVRRLASAIAGAIYQFVGGVSACNRVQCNYAWCRNLRIGDIRISAPCVVRDRLVLQSRGIDQPITPQAAMSWQTTSCRARR